MTSADDVRRSVLDAARSAYAARGYVGTTIKGVAAAAGVAPEVVRRYYDNREVLFAAAMRLPFDPATAVAQLLAPGIDGIGERMVRVTLRMMDDPKTRDQLIEMAKAGASATKTVAPMREFVEIEIIDRVVTSLGLPDARMRAALATSYLLGVATTRYVLKLEPIASATEDDLVRLIGPAIQQVLTSPQIS